MSAIPPHVLSRVGGSARDLTRFGSSRVLAGNGFVLKIGPADRTAREAFIIGEVAAAGPLRLPELVDAGDGWLLLRDVDAVAPPEVTRWRAEAVCDLAVLHDAFEGGRVLEDQRLRDVTGCELPALLPASAQLAVGLALPDPLPALAADPSSLLELLEGPRTLVHGDAWPGNVLCAAAGGRCWIDWEEAGSGHSALDLATWLHGSPWAPPSPAPAGEIAAYLSARATPQDPIAFTRKVDAAAVLLFLLLDLPGIASWDPVARRAISRRRAETAARLG